MTEDEFFRQAIHRFELCREDGRDQRELGVEDLLFIYEEDGQWSENITIKRRDRPRMTIDLLSPELAKLIGNQRQNRTEVKAEPLKDATEDIAKVYTGMIRAILNDSDGNTIHDNAYMETATCGWGGWQIETKFRAGSFDQRVFMSQIDSAVSSLFFDPSAKLYTREDAKFAFLLSYLSLEEFKETYPDAAITDFSGDAYKTSSTQHWFSDNGVQIAEYWYKTPRIRKLGLMSDGRTLDLEEEADVLDELETRGITVVKERAEESYDVKMRIMNGSEFLTEEQDWAGKYIPLIPMFGVTGTIGRKKYTRGIIRKAKDAQRAHNYTTSAVLEATALTPKDPIWITPTQIGNHGDALKKFPSQNSPFLKYDSDPAAPGPPARGGAPALQTALIQQQQQSKADLKSILGVDAQSREVRFREQQSGVALQKQREDGDLGTFIYQDNLERSQIYEGRILVDLLPRILDTEQVTKILGPDETYEDITINEVVRDGRTGEDIIVNDLSQGTYNISAKSGPSFSTRKQETVSQLITLIGDDPVARELTRDLVVANMDLNKGDELNNRFRKYMIKQGTIEPSDEEKEEMGLGGPPPPDPMQEALVENLRAQTEREQIGVEKIIAEIQNKDADTQAKIFKAQKDSVEAFASLTDALLKKIDARLPVTEEDMGMLDGQRAVVEEAQLDTLEQQELGDSVPLAAKGQPQPQPGQQVPPV